VVGFYHSHPVSPAQPSGQDLAEAAYPGSIHVIVSLMLDPAEVRGFRFEGGQFVEVALCADTGGRA